jgi:hypothetical protein
MSLRTGQLDALDKSGPLNKNLQAGLAGARTELSVHKAAPVRSQSRPLQAYALRINKMRPDWVSLLHAVEYVPTSPPIEHQ